MNKNESSDLKKSFINDILGFLKSNKILIAFLFLVLVVRSSIINYYYIPTGSMNPVVPTNSNVGVNKIYYGIQIPLINTYLIRWKHPTPGQIIYAKSPDGTPIVKRVIAVGGDQVSVHKGRVTLNGVLLSTEHNSNQFIESFPNDKTAIIRTSKGGLHDYPLTKIPEGKVLLMGDNRDDSYDGRMFGLIDETKIYGKAYKE